MMTALIVAFLLSAPQASAIHTLAETEPPTMSEGIVLDPLAEAIPANHHVCTYTQCPGGGSVSCTGHSYCTSGTGWVECDGVRKYCGPPPCFKVCMDGYTSCYSDSGNCGGNGIHSISCDGQVYQCGPPIG